MKKLFKNLMMLSAVGAIAFLYSCGEDEEPAPVDAPTVQVSAVAASYDVGQNAQISINYTAAGGLGGIQYTVQIGEDEPSAPVSLDITQQAGDLEGSGTIDIEVTEAMGGNTITIAVTVADQSTPTEQTATASATFTATIPSPDANSGMNTLYGQLNANGGSFYNLTGDEVYGYAATRDEQTANVDFAFFYGSESGYAIAALRDENLHAAFADANVPIDGIFNANDFNFTQFKALEATAEDFDGVETEADIANLIGEVAPDASIANNLEVGTVFAFVLDEEKRQGLSGLMKITETGGDSGASRTLSFEIKYTSPVQ